MKLTEDLIKKLEVALDTRKKDTTNNNNNNISNTTTNY